MKKILKSFLLFAFIGAFTIPAFGATIIINNVDAPGQGFNDATSAQKIGGNNGTTIGQQRLNVFEAAAQVWRDALNSNITIIVQSTFQDRGFTPCTANSAVLGAAASIQDFLDFPNTHWPHTWYKVALANKLANEDLAPGAPSPTSPDPGFLQPPFGDDIIAFFNPNLGQANCFAGGGWYYGLDHKEGAGQTDLLSVVIHEIGHGLGFANIVDEDGDIASHQNPGEGLLGFTDAYSVFTHDNTSGKQWNQMTDGERAASAINTGNVVWNGPTVTGQSDAVLANQTDLKITSGSASGTILEPFGTGDNVVPTSSNFNGTAVAVNDGTAAPSVTDGCEPYSGFRRQIAVVDRGTCSFAVKAANAQAAGATGLIVINNAGGDAVIGMLIGSAAKIPAVMISTIDGAFLRTVLPASIGLIENPNQSAGADANDQVKLYAPNPVQPGSSISHWDTSATPNLIMEPFATSTLTSNLDLTDEQMTDIGWDGNLHCPNNSDRTSATLVLANSCNSGVTNYDGPFTVYPSGSTGTASGAHFTAGGCSLVDTYQACSTYIQNAGQYSQCVGRVTQALVNEGVLSSAESDAILACVD